MEVMIGDELPSITTSNSSIPSLISSPLEPSTPHSDIDDEDEDESPSLADQMMNTFASSKLQSLLNLLSLESDVETIDSLPLNQLEDIVTDGVLNYASYLVHQRYYDDLKHVDFKHINYGDFNGRVKSSPSHASSSSTLITQNKALGKGGFTWDAAFVLSEYLMDSLHVKPGLAILELGAGTGLVGCALGQFFLGECKQSDPSFTITITDLPSLVPLIQTNVSQNFPTAQSTPHPIIVEKLEWGIDDLNSTKLYDVIIGADIVASLYDPIALAQTIYNLSHDSTVVYVAFKERASEFHHSFEDAIGGRFEDVKKLGRKEIDVGGGMRNLNPDVGILVIQKKKGKEEVQCCGEGGVDRI